MAGAAALCSAGVCTLETEYHVGAFRCFAEICGRPGRLLSIFCSILCQSHKRALRVWRLSIVAGVGIVKPPGSEQVGLFGLNSL